MTLANTAKETVTAARLHLLVSCLQSQTAAPQLLDTTLCLLVLLNKGRWWHIVAAVSSLHWLRGSLRALGSDGCALRQQGCSRGHNTNMRIYARANAGHTVSSCAV